jgi:hypothetical protein
LFGIFVRQVKLLIDQGLFLIGVPIFLQDLLVELEEIPSLLEEGIHPLASDVVLSPIVLKDVRFLFVADPLYLFVLKIL